MKIFSIIILFLGIFFGSVILADTDGLAARINSMATDCQKPKNKKDSACDYFIAFYQMLKPPVDSTPILPLNTAETNKVVELLKQNGLKVVKSDEECEKAEDETYFYSVEDGETIFYKCPGGMGIKIYKGDFSNEKTVEYALVADIELLAIYKQDGGRLVDVPYENRIISSLLPHGDMSKFYMFVADPFAIERNGKTYIRFMRAPLGHTDYDKGKLQICTYLWQGNNFSLAGPNFNFDSADGKIVPSLNCIGERSTPSSPSTGDECQNVKSAYDKNYCYEKLFVQADKDLNKIYNLLKDSLIPEKKQQLIIEERKWIVQRNKDCTNQGTIKVSCNLKITKSRTDELRTRLNWIQSHTTTSSSQKPRRADFNDCGYRDTDPKEGWYDAQGQGVSNDYCRYVGDYPVGRGSSKNWFACALAGDHSDYSDRIKYTDTSSWLNTFQPILPGDKCYREQ